MKICSLFCINTIIKIERFGCVLGFINEDIMDINGVLAEFAVATGMSGLALDENLRCSILFDDEVIINLEHDPEDNALLLSATIRTLVGVNNEEFIKALLKASFLGSKTGGAAFSINEYNDDIVLWKRLDDVFVEYSIFEKQLNDFLAQVLYWKENILNLNSGSLSADNSVADFDHASQFIMPV